MFHYSFSTVLMTVLTSTVLVVIIAICFRRDKVFLSVGDKLLAILIVLALLRFIFPIEMPFSVNVYLPESLSIVISSIRHTSSSIGPFGLSVWAMIECVWFGGIVYKLFRIVSSHVTFNCFINRYGINVTEKEPFKTLLSKICDSHKVDFRIIQVPRLDAPRQSGILHPCILLPMGLSFTEDEIDYIIRHEFAHYRHHDFLIKQGMNLLTALYWWNPLCYTLSRQLDTLLEIKADQEVIAANSTDKLKYYQSLYAIGTALTKKQQESNESPTKFPYLATPKMLGGNKVLENRANLALYYERASKPVFLLILAIVLSVFVASYCFTFEAHYVPECDSLGDAEVFYDELYAIMLEDGTYDIYLNDILVEHVDSLTYYVNIPVIIPEE